MRIEIWSDVVCPWCFIGKRRLEKAIEETGLKPEIVWKSFELDPSSPKEPTQSVVEHLADKYGGGVAGAQQMMDRVEAVAAEEGLLYRLKDSKRANTVDAHRLLHLALHEGGTELQGQLKEELLSAYFLRAENPADHAALKAAALTVGLDEKRVDEVLGSKEFTDEVESDVREAASLGASGVPFFVIDRKYGISGAQPTEVFAQALRQAAAESIQTVGADQADGACGPDGCAI
jgi:predicted DsbA family dithiol-disulfide isomerase